MSKDGFFNTFLAGGSSGPADCRPRRQHEFGDIVKNGKVHCSVDGFCLSFVAWQAPGSVKRYLSSTCMLHPGNTPVDTAQQSLV